ncbi:tRNA dimethylallyltransferase isoform X2 [Anabrus simplex]|uniref:tRNA dimethylallyltransferase isoform X2 n=1 Tax=Anabrus simplex TaxID=316456 RepID=UPI0035A290E5
MRNEVYKGMDIITNKVTKEEQAEVPHHMLDLVDPPARFTVVDFRNAALKIMDRLMKQGKVPILVGGTNYYIESILWKVLVSGEKDFIERSGSLEDGQPDTKRVRIESDLEAMDNRDLYRRLQEVDPDMAKRLHPNNRRRIIRSLQVFEQLGRTHSAVLQEQREVAGGSELGGPLRFPHSCILWLQCKQSVLDERLDSRVDDMIERGLVEELLRFHEKYNQQRIAINVEADYTKGIFQSIGFKEFHKYLMLDPSERNSEYAQKLFKEALDQLKLVTRRYSRKQLRWVTNRFLRQRDRQVPPVYGLDTSDLTKWEENVYKPAKHVVDCFMKGSTPTEVEPMTLVEALSNKPESFHCDICDRLFVGTLQWEAHRISKKHQRFARRKQMERTLSSFNTNKTNGAETAINSEVEPTVDTQKEV